MITKDGIRLLESVVINILTRFTSLFLFFFYYDVLYLVWVVSFLLLSFYL